MEGMTIDEIAEKLGIPWKTAHKRIERLGIKPLSYKALYDPAVVEAIRNIKIGRPPKAKPELEMENLVETLPKTMKRKSKQDK